GVFRLSHGTLKSVGGSQSTFTYTPDLGFFGADTLQFTVTDTGDPAGTTGNKLTSLPGTWTITVTPVNKPPTAIGQTVTGTGNHPLPITLSGFDQETPA